MTWELIRLNEGPGTVAPGPAAAPYDGHDIAASAYGSNTWPSSPGSQIHFAYIDANGNIQDIYGAMFKGNNWTYEWTRQQLTNAPARSSGVPSVNAKCQDALDPAIGGLHISVWGTQLHFTYFTAHGYIHDVFYADADSRWHSQTINGENGVSGGSAVRAAGGLDDDGILVVGSMHVCTYNGQQHFAYIDSDGNVQDVWWDGVTWHLQQITNVNAAGTVVAEQLCYKGDTPQARSNLFVCAYHNQQHFVYLDSHHLIQDVWYDGYGGWHLQQINGTAPSVRGEWIAVPSAPPAGAGGDVFVCTYHDQMHVTYAEANGRIHDVWCEGDGGWHLQQI